MILTHEGITQPVEEWALDYGIPSETIRKRIGRGWPVAEAIEIPVLTHGRPSQRYRFDGRSLTVAEWAKLSGLSAFTLRSRLRLGWTIGRAVTERPQLTGKGPRKSGGGYQATSAVSIEDRRPRHAQDCA
ncbi:hypothetical protein [Methylopila sp. 73B]|uniref:hypothetical protein n=1 Tax=Methylopila sp. 73B TaxID=1120792 RepID=UPI0003633652|nr:hypothetical protein [Methylopila sp. 73B]